MQPVFTLISRILFFRFDKTDIENFTFQYFLVGLVGTWVAGMGRYWDSTKASFLQKLGVGSVVYIFALAAFIWLIVLPFKIKDWAYSRVLTFISLTSFPAIIYAFPIEKFASLDTSAAVNAWFLLIVATWRMALLVRFFRKATDLDGTDLTSVALLPMALIVTSLSFLNLEKVVFNIMGGFESSSSQTAYLVLIGLTIISNILVLPLLIMYIVGIVARQKQLKNKRI